MTSETLTIERPNQAALIEETGVVLSNATSLVIDSNDMYEIAASELSAIKKRAKELEAKRVSLTKPLDEVKKGLMDLFRVPLEKLTSAETAIKKAMIAYTDEQERKRREEQARLDAIARQQREALEREAKEKAELAAKAEAAAKEEQAKIAAIANAETRAKLEAENAEKAEAAKAAAAEAEALQLAAAVVTPQVAVQNTAQAAGVSARVNWKAEVLNKAELIAFIANNQQYANLLDVNQSALNQLARGMRDLMKIPGVKAYQEKIIASRA